MVNMNYRSLVRILSLMVFCVAIALPLKTFAQLSNLPQNFEAFVDNSDIAVGQTVNVKLELTGVSPTGIPDMSKIPSGMKITAQSQESKTAIINGRQTGSISWIYTLMPSKEGNYDFPEIAVNTETGTHYTRPFRITVKDSGTLPSDTADKNVSIEASLNKDVVYLGEPAIYTVKIFTRYTLNNADLKKPAAEGIVIDQIGEPKNSNQVINGVNYNVVTVDFLVTPTKPGRTSIGASVLRGRIALNTSQQPLNSFMDISQMAVTPFTIASKSININVKEPVKAVDPWLVAEKLEAQDEVALAQTSPNTSTTETASSQPVKVKVGEPFTRKIMLYSEGRFGNSLPDLEALVQNENFKIYADKPVSSGEIKLDAGQFTLIGKKAQNFNYIAQKAGEFDLPEIKINWWNPAKDVMETTIIASHKIIAEGAATSKDQADNNVNAPQAQDTANQPQQQTSNDKPAMPVSQQPNYPKAESTAASPAQPKDTITQVKENFINMDFETLLMIIAGISIFGLLVLRAFTAKPVVKQEPNLIRRELASSINKPAARTTTPPATKYVGGRRVAADFEDKPVAPPAATAPIKSNSFFTNKVDEIDNMRNAAELVEFMQNYAKTNLGMKANASIIAIAENLHTSYNIDSGIIDFAKQLDANIFASKEIDFANIRNAFKQVMAYVSANKPASNNKVNEDFDKLNPF